MKIFIIFNAKAFTLEDIEPSDSIRMVKNEIYLSILSVYPADQIIYLAHDNKPLGDDTKLADLNITDGSTLHLVERTGKRNIYVIFNAEAFTLEVIEPSDSIQSVKKKIEAKKGIHPADQIIYLAHDNKPLGDDTKLADLNITEGSTLHLVERKGEKSEEKTD